MKGYFPFFKIQYSHMKKASRAFFKILRKPFKSKLFTIVFSLVAAGVLINYAFFHHPPTYQFVTVTRGNIVESVTLTGNTAPAQSVSLAFGSSGIIAHAFVTLGGKVHAGQVVAELNTSDLVAQLRQAQADVDTQQARLAGLKSGSRPEDIAASQAALDKAKQDLVNMYSEISDTSVDSYAKASDAIRTQLDPFFTNANSINPKLTYSTVNDQDKYDAELKRASVNTTMDNWQKDIAAISKDTSEATLDSEIGYLSAIRQLLNSISKTLDGALGLSATTLSTYRTDVNVALNEVNTATKNLNSISQSIASQKLTISQLQAQLELKKAGSSATDISAQEAQVEQALASVESVRAKIQNAEIIAPISGVISQFDAKVGQLASPSTALVSIISDTGYEVDAGVSETDVGKIMVGDKVAMTLDAFPNESFPGSVFYIAPSETNTQGVVSYQTKISFDKPDERLKSGLTANIDIETKNKSGVLILPQYAILQNDEGTYVETMENGTTKMNPVTLGIQDTKGNVEILTGVSEGEQVLNIGLKAK
jgi:HlyD family secretion protein